MGCAAAEVSVGEGGWLAPSSQISSCSSLLSLVSFVWGCFMWCDDAGAGREGSSGIVGSGTLDVAGLRNCDSRIGFGFG